MFVDTAGAGDIAVRDGSIAFRNITFNYGRDQPEHANRIIKGLSLDIKAGEKVGLVGRSGAGKSTLVNLLLRFHDLENGQILIDGQDISTVRQESLREHIAMVTQEYVATPPLGSRQYPLWAARCRCRSCAPCCGESTGARVHPRSGGWQRTQWL